ncbi:MAG: peptidylprolyl isomerase [Candidatus Omnitrophica bacterium]|nr:peptidylprolyl isomerase [Candidatus Omnitrophota bacterium]
MGIEKGKKVTLNYTVTTEGQTVDSTEGTEPFVYVHGEEKILPALAENLEGMEIGEKKSIEIPPEKAYGARSEAAFKELPRTALPGNVEPQVGMLLESKSPSGATSVIRISEIKPDTVVVDLNHPLAGKTLTFDVEIMSVD